MYQVFPDRFARSAAADDREAPGWAEPAAWDDPVAHVGPSTSRQFYGGDLAGVAEHLDHLVDLGVNLLYLTPVFPARSNHRYDALSFDHVDPLLGGDEALAALVEAAHARGIRVIGDLTTNHSGDAHEWFQAALGNPRLPSRRSTCGSTTNSQQYVSWLGRAEPAEAQLASRGVADAASSTASTRSSRAGSSRRSRSTAGGSTSPT